MSDQYRHVSKAVEKLSELGGINLTELARGGRLARAHGRAREVNQLLSSVLERRSALLLGPSGAGKTAVLHEAIHQCLEGRPPAARDKWFFQFSTTRIESGALNAGGWSANLKDVLDAAIPSKSIFLYIDNIWDLRDAGRYSDFVQSFATFLKPYLETRQLVLIGESTPENFTRSSAHGLPKAFALADDPSLMAQFDVITLEEPDPVTLRSILSTVAMDLERAHQVEITGPAIERCTELTRRFQPYRAFPGKAVHLLQEAIRTRSHIERREAPAAGPPSPAKATITPEIVMSSFSAMTHLPAKLFSDQIPLRREDVLGYFSERVVGQEEAVSSVVDLVALIKAELNDPARPLGVLLFVGPTGSGKTFMAKTMAEYIFGSQDKFVRFDMSEFISYESVANLARMLVERIRKESFSVLLLDEIEKAADPVFDLFLQAFDDARLTDPSGRTADLRNTIIVMTSNLGTEGPRRSLGLVDSGEQVVKEQEWRLRAVEEYFRPEFVNRLDRVVVFNPLDEQHMRQIARRELGAALLREGVLRRNILLDFQDDVLDVLVRAGFDAVYGARPLQRTIKELVLVPLAWRIACEPEAGEQVLELRVSENGIDFASLLPPPPLPLLAVSSPEPEETIKPARPPIRDARGAHAKLKQLAGAIDALRARLESDRTSERFTALMSRATELLEEMAKPTFWDDPVQARKTLSLSYHQQQVLSLFDALAGRIDAGANRAMMVERHRDWQSIQDLEARSEELERELLLAELQLAASNPLTAQPDAAIISISPIVDRRASDAGDWPLELARMYTAWSEKKGYEVRKVSEDGRSEVLLLVRGSAVATLLAGEDGIHKRQSSPGGASRGREPGSAEVQLARVEIVPYCGDGAGGQADAGLAIRIAEIAEVLAAEERVCLKLVEVCCEETGATVRVVAEDPVPIAMALLSARQERNTLSGHEADTVRLYNVGRTEFVRDSRTGERIGRVRTVLAGNIDSFLLAYLKAFNPASASVIAPPAP